MKKYIIVDVDHTLSDAFWRDGLITHYKDGQKDADWEVYNSLSVHDAPFREVVDLVNAYFKLGVTVLAVTSRPERWYSLTSEWFMKNDIACNVLIMRDNHDQSTPSPILKVANVGAYIKRAHGTHARIADWVEFIIEDRDDVCEAFRALGVLCLQVKVAQRHVPSIKVTS